MKKSLLYVFVVISVSVFGLFSCRNNETKSIRDESGFSIPNGFVKIDGTEISDSKSLKPASSVLGSGRIITIPTLLVCDHEVTRGEFKEIMKIDPSSAIAYDKFGSKLTGEAVLNNPVNSVSWYHAIAYCNKKSISENLEPCYDVKGITDWKTLSYDSIPMSIDTTWNVATCNFKANGYRLPTEAEWEYLARGGKNYTYSGSNKIENVAWYSTNTNDTGTRDVKTKLMNEYKLYDMSGNVWEWCWDWFGSISILTDKSGVSSGSARVIRGGSWYNSGNFCTVISRSGNSPNSRYGNLGFRVVRLADNLL